MLFMAGSAFWRLPGDGKVVGMDARLMRESWRRWLSVEARTEDFERDKSTGA